MTTTRDATSASRAGLQSLGIDKRMQVVESIAIGTLNLPGAIRYGAGDPRRAHDVLGRLCQHARERRAKAGT